jgi:hypothetical protein
MTGMETTATVSTDLEAVTDLVLKRQLIDVQRDHATGIVKMVLECATEAAGPAEPAYKPKVRRIDATIKAVDIYSTSHGFCDHISYVGVRDRKSVLRASAYGPPRNDPASTEMTVRLHELLGHDVSLWVNNDMFFGVPTIVQFSDLWASA